MRDDFDEPLEDFHKDFIENENNFSDLSVPSLWEMSIKYIVNASLLFITEILLTILLLLNLWLKTFPS